MLELLTDPQAWIAFLTLTALELVLGIDNIVFISILVDRLPPERRDFTRRLGLALALIMRILLLLTLAWLAGLTAPLFTVLGEEISGRDLILIAGGALGDKIRLADRGQKAAHIQLELARASLGATEHAPPDAMSEEDTRGRRPGLIEKGDPRTGAEVVAVLDRLIANVAGRVPEAERDVVRRVDPQQQIDMTPGRPVRPPEMRLEQDVLARHDLVQAHRVDDPPPLPQLL